MRLREPFIDDVISQKYKIKPYIFFSLTSSRNDSQLAFTNHQKLIFMNEKINKKICL
jgi:hypothetical protein